MGKSPLAGSNPPPETMMTFLPFVIQRATRHWQILLTLSLGVIMATAQFGRRAAAAKAA